MKVNVAYSPMYLDWNLGVNHPTNPIRAKLAVDLLRQNPALDLRVLDPNGLYSPEDYVTEVKSIHDHGYVDRVLSGVSGEWHGVNFELGTTALMMFAGTMVLVEDMLRYRGHGVRWLGFNPQGAKHHAMFNHSSGFCVFNDMAYAARRLRDAGKRVVYVDWDAHHGDGVEAMLKDDEDILTISVHDSTSFPGTGFEDGEGFHNYPMDEGAGDTALRQVVDDIRDTLLLWSPDVILLACGADGLAGDPLTSLNYTQEGLDHASRMIGSVARRLDADVLIGGAGGYQPFDEVPEHWSRCVSTIARWLSI